MYAAIESRSMLIGAAAFFLYSVVCCQLMLRGKFHAAPVTIAAVEELERPSEEQEIHKSLVGKPQLVKVAAPTKQSRGIRQLQPLPR